MRHSLAAHLRGAVALTGYTFNTLFWCVPLFAVAVLKLLLPWRPLRRQFDRLLNGVAKRWVGVNNFNQRMIGRTRLHVHGVDELRKKEWYLIIANHQSWVDILVLQRIFHDRIPFIKFFLKQELIWFPVLGLAWWALDMPFMKRYSKKFIARHPRLAGRDLEITRKACEKFRSVPVAIMNFAEGTRFTTAKKRRQASPYRGLLRPKAGGVAFTLGAMGDCLNSLLDVTIAYPGGRRRFWDFMCGGIADIHVRVRTLPITREMLGDYFNDEGFRERFQGWLNRLWGQKDLLLASMLAGSSNDAAPGLPVFPPLAPDPLPGRLLTRLHSAAAPDKSPL